jgi:hypothetical protein
VTLFIGKIRSSTCYQDEIQCNNFSSLKCKSAVHLNPNWNNALSRYVLDFEINSISRIILNGLKLSYLDLTRYSKK